MTIRLLGYPLRFLQLTDDKGHRLYWRYVPAIFVLTLLLSIPFILLRGSNYFGEDGFLDRVGGFSSALTGFYIAGLVAVAAFGKEMGSLDKVIQVGPVLLPSHEKDEGPDRLTRREYVCLMFGYLAFVSLALTLMAIVGLAISKSVSELFTASGGADEWLSRSRFRAGTIIFYSMIVSSLCVTTFHGLYYLIDRLYAKSPEIKKKDVIENTADKHAAPKA